MIQRYSDSGFTGVMEPAVSQRNHAGLRAVFKSEPQPFTGVGDEYGVTAFRVFRFYVFGFVDVEGGVPWVFGKEFQCLVNGAFLFLTQKVIAFQEYDFK